MDSGAKYSALEHGGLEVAPSGDVPEVYAPEAEEGSKEVVPGSGAPLERRKSNDAAEVMHPGQYEQQQPHPEESTVQPYYAPDSKAQVVGGATADKLESGNSKPERRYCGMKRGLFFVVIAIVVVVILGAVLGGVLGTVLNKNHTSNQNNGINNSGINISGSSSSGSSSAGSNNGSATDSSDLNNTSSTSPPIQALAGTGLATTIVASGTGRILMYYQDDQSRIIENSYFDNTWTLQDSSNLDQSVVVASMAQQGSPMAAIAYERNGTIYRQVFFLDASGTLHETNSSTVTNGIATSWSQPLAISASIASPNCISIAACVNYAPMNGIRVYYGAADASNGKYVQETLYGFDQQIWMDGSYFPEGDADSGIACGIWNATNSNSQYVDLYFRNVTSGVVQQEFWDYSTNSGWYNGPVAESEVSMLQGGSLAVCDDQGDTEYIYWPLDNGTVVRGYLSPDSSNNFSGYSLQDQTISAGTNLAATWTGDGALLLFQNSTDTSTVWMAEVARNEQVIVDAAVV